MDFTRTELIWLGSVFLRMLLALVLSGLVGYEREHASRPAGFRTHILVGLGSSLVMVTAEFIARQADTGTPFDITRMGASVISGIGFLGAGTIIRNGSSVKGLTTAASLWAVACIGLAAGGGFYAGAIIATLLTFMALIPLKRLEKKFLDRYGDRSLLIILRYYSTDVQHILRIAEDMDLSVRKLQLLPLDEEEAANENVRLRLTASHLPPDKKARLVEEIYKLTTVIKVEDD